MKKLFSVVALCLIFCICISPEITWSLDEGQVDSLCQSEQANYMIGRYVIGGGGIIGATSANNRHHATIGQTIVGRTSGSNYILLAGFWLASGGPVGIQTEDPIALPTEFKLHQNFPNPFNPETTIEYDLPNACLVTVEIFNTVGQRISVISSQIQGPGYAAAVWDGHNDQGEAMGSGVYFYRITASLMKDTKISYQIQFQQTMKMLLIK